ncbi:pyridoxamine 5'-phosphate oxidase family protein, partial [Actinomadura adrarensis]
MRERWSDAVDDVLDGDLAVMLAYRTPARGVVLTPMTNFALRDRQAGTVTLATSLGMWKKLDRMRKDPHVALAFHTRRHGYGSRPEYVLVQGKASFSWRPDRVWLESIRDEWERFMGPR